MQRIYIYIFNGCKPESGYATNIYIYKVANRNPVMQRIYIYVTVANRNPVMQRIYIYIYVTVANRNPVMQRMYIYIDI